MFVRGADDRQRQSSFADIAVPALTLRLPAGDFSFELSNA